MTDVGSALESLTQALKKRERELDEREAELSEQQKRLKTEIISAYGDTSPSDVIQLNVGGKRLDVLRRTLCSVEGSMLASKFSGRWDDSLEKDRDGNIFLDLDFDDFKMMIDFLRDKAIESPQYPVTAPQGNEKFFRLLEYYGMTDGVYPTCFVPCYVPDDKEDVFELIKGGHTRISCKEWCSFKIKWQGHKRGVKSVEIKLGKVERLQFGYQFFTRKDWEACKFDYSLDAGVGDLDYTCAIDPIRQCALNAGSRTFINGVKIHDGSIIKLDHPEGNWYVDGKLVASATVEKNGIFNMDVADLDYGYGRTWVLSIKGEAQLIKIKYE